MGNTSKLRGKAEILSEIYVSAEVETMIRSLKPQHLQDDIKQHCFLELFEKPEAFIMDLHDRGKLKAYICKTMYNTARFTRTSFAKQQGKEILFEDFKYSTQELKGYNGNQGKDDEWVELTGSDHLKGSFDEIADEGYEEINIDLSTLHWYKRELLKLYAEEGTYQKVSDKTHIPMTSVYQTVLETRKQILKEYHASQRG